MMGVNAVRAGLTLLAVTLLFGLTACFGGPSAGDKEARLTAALESAGSGVVGAKVVTTPSAAGGLTVTVKLSSDALEPGGREVAAATLTRILAVTADIAADMKVTSLYLYADDESGKDLSFRDAATELGLQKSLNGDSLTLVAEEWTSYAGK